MKDSKLLAITTTTLLMAAAAPALAAVSAPVGWYLEAGAGSTTVSGKSYPGNANRSGAGGGFTAGYKFMRYFGAEIDYTLYQSSNITDPSTDSTAAFDRHYSYDVALKGILPIRTSGFELFAKLGLDQVKSSVGIDNHTAATNLGITANSHTANGIYSAVGVQYYFAPVMAMNLQYAYAQGNSQTGNPSLLSIGLSLLFG